VSVSVKPYSPAGLVHARLGLRRCASVRILGVADRLVLQVDLAHDASGAVIVYSSPMTEIRR
jgi:hypothetical protein